MRLRSWGILAAGVAGLVAISLLAAIASGHPPRAQIAAPKGCADPYPAAPSPSNPLLLPAAPGSDPLQGANFFVDGPRHGLAAGQIARLLGIDASTPVGTALPSFVDSESYATFLNTVNRLLPSNPSAAHDVGLLEKIASEPEPNRFSSFSGGGSPAAIATQVAKVFCHNLTADPGSIPIITTYFLHATLGGCPSTSQIDAYDPLFHQRVDSMVQAVGNRPAVWLLEIDAIGSSHCIATHHALGAWEAAIRYEVEKVGSMPHAVVYVEGGYSDSNSTAYTARMLNAVGVRTIRGFWTNDTHINWTSDEITRDEKLSKMTGGAHFIINTSDNGNGPKLNPHPSTQGIEDLCNPPGRAMGPRPTTDTGVANADAFMWTHTPGVSSGCGGGPPGGVWWPAKALRLAAAANGRLGPHSPSMPY